MFFFLTVMMIMLNLIQKLRPEQKTLYEKNLLLWSYSYLSCRENTPVSTVQKDLLLRNKQFYLTIFI